MYSANFAYGAEGSAAPHAAASSGGGSGAAAAHVNAPAGEVTRSAPSATVSTPSNSGNASAPHAAPANSQASPQQNNGNSTGHSNSYDHRYGTVYGTPFWPYTYNYNSGWNGNGYYNNGTYIQSSDSPNTSTDNSSSSASVPPETPPVVQQGQTAAGAEAQTSNAIDKSPEMVAANNVVQTAQADFNSERERVLAALNQKPEYQQALARQHDAQKELHDVRSGVTTAPAVVSAATDKLEASDEVTKMQEQAVATDPAASAAKQRLMQAIANRDSLRANMLVHH